MSDQPLFPWKSWDEVPRDPHAVAQQGFWFLELFSGTANLTQAMLDQGIPCLPPVDITPCPLVPRPMDVVDSANWDLIMHIIRVGGVRFLHCGTPCNTFSSARKADGGPPPLRSKDRPLGLQELSADNQALVFLGNLFLDRSVEAIFHVLAHGGDFSLENPELSLMWNTPQVARLLHWARAYTVDFDQCIFGAPSVKPTRLLVSHQAFQLLCGRCDGGHSHERLTGQIWSDHFQKLVYRTKLAQVYPAALCSSMATIVHNVWASDASQFSSSFTLVAGKRKRPVGQALRWKMHRQQLTAIKAVAAGYQLKRGALKPLLDVETEPGTAIAWALSISHPLTAELVMDPQLQCAVDALTMDPAAVVTRRLEELQHWEARAQQLLPQTDQILSRLPDPALRRLLRGTTDDQPVQLGARCHILLYYEMLDAANSVDKFLPDLLLHGFPIVGAIARSGRWPSYDKEQAAVPIAQVLERAWEIRRKIITRVQSVAVSDNLKKIWESTLEDVTEGSTLGLFRSEAEVSSFLGSEEWIPTQRFEVVQKNKVRGCDSATTNMINPMTVITEKLQLPSTDSNVAALRQMRSQMPHSKFAGWVLDERKAYRQVAIKPDHRRFSVICLKDPVQDKPAFFIMVGHSFGLVSAVYNYNRRSAAINELLLVLFNMIAFNFYDDKYGFEPEESVQSAFMVAQRVHWLLGAAFDQKKLQLTRQPVILGVTYNLDDWILEIKADRRDDLISEISAILDENVLEPGHAGKLKGKLMFGASQLWGKIGRAFLRVLSERQYARFPCSETFCLDPPLREALSVWIELIRKGPPRSIDFRSSKKADGVLFTDGFSPDPRDVEWLPDRIGAVLFDRRALRPVQFTSVVPEQVKRKFLARRTQIIPVELVAPIVALETFKDLVRGSDLLLFIDSEVVEAALVKGYSSREDLCSLISVFWNLVLELRVRVFIDRVATDANPADWPSRDHLEVGESVGWATWKPRWPDLESTSVQREGDEKGPGL